MTENNAIRTLAKGMRVERKRDGARGWVSRVFTLTSNINRRMSVPSAEITFVEDDATRIGYRSASGSLAWVKRDFRAV